MGQLSYTNSDKVGDRRMVRRLQVVGNPENTIRFLTVFKAFDFQPLGSLSSENWLFSRSALSIEDWNNKGLPFITVKGPRCSLAPVCIL